jgi:hypothetical protein
MTSPTLLAVDYTCLHVYGRNGLPLRSPCAWTGVTGAISYACRRLAGPLPRRALAEQVRHTRPYRPVRLFSSIKRETGAVRCDRARRRKAGARPCEACPSFSYLELDTMNHEAYQPYIDACDACAAACDRCASACLEEPGVAVLAKCIRLNFDCASLCRLTSAALARQSRFAPEFCALCARICDECADECAGHAPEHCGACSDACRMCAEVCRTI